MLEKVVPWRRFCDEYLAMFDLTENSLNRVGLSAVELIRQLGETTPDFFSQVAVQVTGQHRAPLTSRQPRQHSDPRVRHVPDARHPVNAARVRSLAGFVDLFPDDRFRVKPIFQVIPLAASALLPELV